MATHRIVLLITDEELAALGETQEVLDEVAEGGELNDDYADEVARCNRLYRVLGVLKEKVETELLST